jgi:hypothetical protein
VFKVVCCAASIHGARPVAHLIPLSLAWIDECVVVAAPARQQTARNILAGRTLMRGGAWLI